MTQATRSGVFFSQSRSGAESSFDPGRIRLAPRRPQQGQASCGDRVSESSGLAEVHVGRCDPADIVYCRHRLVRRFDNVAVGAQ
jgi:hypothetical protein